MTPKELMELMELTGWSREKLADTVGLRSNTVDKWLSGDRKPGPTASRVLRDRLERARQKAQPA